MIWIIFPEQSEHFHSAMLARINLIPKQIDGIVVRRPVVVNRYKSIVQFGHPIAETAHQSVRQAALS